MDARAAMAVDHLPARAESDGRHRTLRPELNRRLCFARGARLQRVHGVDDHPALHADGEQRLVVTQYEAVDCPVHGARRVRGQQLCREILRVRFRRRGVHEVFLHEDLQLPSASGGIDPAEPTAHRQEGAGGVLARQGLL